MLKCRLNIKIKATKIKYQLKGLFNINDINNNNANTKKQGKIMLKIQNIQHFSLQRDKLA